MTIEATPPSYPRNATQALIALLESDIGGVAVVWYDPQPGSRSLERQTTELTDLAGPDAETLRASSVDQALRAPDRLVVLVPDDEAACVQELEGRLGQVLDPPRAQPVVLLLSRHGAGREALCSAPELSSLVRGRSPDPDEIAEIDVVRERAQFEAWTGLPVQDWLANWRAGKIPRTGASLALSYLAQLIEEHA